MSTENVSEQSSADTSDQNNETVCDQEETNVLTDCSIVQDNKDSTIDNEKINKSNSTINTVPSQDSSQEIYYESSNSMSIIENNPENVCSQTECETSESQTEADNENSAAQLETENKNINSQMSTPDECSAAPSETQHKKNSEMDSNEEVKPLSFEPYARKDELRQAKERKAKKDTNRNDISIQMYRYLKHKDFKQKISDLCERETIFVNKRCWDEALRLREMKNELILLKYKNLYENQDFDIDEEARKIGSEIIKAREMLNKQRDKVCSTMMYSDTAREFWNQWVREDDSLANTESNLMKNFFTELEGKWTNLAVSDKDYLSQLSTTMNESTLQDEDKLSACIKDHRQRQLFNNIVN